MQNTPRDIIGDFDSSCQGQISRRSLEGRLRRPPVETSPDLKRTSVLLKDDLNFERWEVELLFFLFFLFQMRMAIQNYTVVSLEIEVPNRVWRMWYKIYKIHKNMGWAQAVSHFNLVPGDTCHFNFLFFCMYLW